MVPENPSSKGQAWFCNTGLSASDVTVEVDGMAFHLHKFPLTSKSRKLMELISKQEKKTKKKNHPTRPEIQEREDEDEDEDGGEEEYPDDEDCHMILTNFPGGSETFETAAKFCYSVKISISFANAAPLLCAADYLQMTEDHSEDNLIARTERYLTQSVFRNIRSSIKTLSTCQKLLPVAEDSGIVSRCIEAIVSRAPDWDPALLGWPVNDNGRRKPPIGGGADNRSWLDELGNLSMPFFLRLISGISRSTRRYSSSPSSSSSSGSSDWSQRELLEAIVSNLTKEKTKSNATRYLFGLLRSAYILNVSELCKSTLEKKIGAELERAALDDLLIPSYSYLSETLYDVDCVERILRFFLRGLVEGDDRSIAEVDVDEDGGARSAALVLVGKLIDGYLSEIASDAILKPEKFYNFATVLPNRARLFHDGLYRAVDVYLKAHSWIPEAEREKIVGVLDWQKLTLEACTHAAQNERLPLKAVVQVLFFEQLQLRHAIAGTLVSATEAEGGDHISHRGGVRGGGEEEGDRGEGGNSDLAVMARPREAAGAWPTAERENQALRADMASMTMRVHELERECSTMRKAIEKMDKIGHVERGGWRAKFGCKFKTQVCDSQEPSTVGGPKSKARTPHRRR